MFETQYYWIHEAGEVIRDQGLAEKLGLRVVKKANGSMQGVFEVKSLDDDTFVKSHPVLANLAKSITKAEYAKLLSKA